MNYWHGKGRVGIVVRMTKVGGKRDGNNNGNTGDSSKSDTRYKIQDTKLYLNSVW